jgi:hypothetical protein
MRGDVLLAFMPTGKDGSKKTVRLSDIRTTSTLMEAKPKEMRQSE